MTSNVIAATCVANEYVQATIVRVYVIFDNVASTHDTSSPKTSDVQNITYQIALSAKDVERVFVVLSTSLSLY